MPRILLISSHYPPSNLTATHRVRMLAKYLPLSGWNPIVLTVDQNFYEEKPDFSLNELIPDHQSIQRVRAFNLTKPRLIGDLGLRAFFQLYTKANEIISREKIDFIYIFIPSFYLSLLGPLLKRLHGINYGIDYIDPWVHFFPGSEKKFSRHWFSTKLAKILEPVAVKGASLITSVSESYVQPIFERHQELKKSVQLISFPYGWDPDEKNILSHFKSRKPLFGDSNKLRLVYTGAFLPNSEKVFIAWLKCIKHNIHLFHDVEIHFIGTGVPKSSTKRPTITSIATEFSLYGSVIFEHPNRISYFDVLNHIANADGLFILGSTESHYTPSKMFNAFIVGKPIFAILHPHSTAKQIIEETEWGLTTSYSDTTDNDFHFDVINQFQNWKYKSITNSWGFNQRKAMEYSAQCLTEKLASSLNALL